MPTSKVFQITSAYIESLHDTGIAIGWPGIEPVDRYDCLDLNLLESAAEQPFQSGFGVEFYPTVYDKAACLFFSIAGGHIFSNGNKRTAVLTLDQFLYANSIYLLLDNKEMQALAERTATYRTRGENAKDVMERISQLIADNSFEFRIIRKKNPHLYSTLHRLKNLIRSLSLNKPGTRPRQALLTGR